MKKAGKRNEKDENRISKIIKFILKKNKKKVKMSLV